MKISIIVVYVMENIFNTCGFISLFEMNTISKVTLWNEKYVP